MEEKDFKKMEEDVRIILKRIETLVDSYAEKLKKNS
jgi:hypothetical protein